MKEIPFFKPTIEEDEIAEVVDVLRSGWLTTGPRAKLFEAQFARYINQLHAVAVNSCTAALHLALDAIGIKRGELVIVPTMTFAATAEVVSYFDADPLLVDCREGDLGIDCADARRKITAALNKGLEVRAILPVHYGGQICDIEGVRKLAEEFSLRVIEDAAHCCPAYFRKGPEQAWQPVGATSDISCFSFYANKTITTGEGGMVCTNNEAFADHMRIKSLHGISKEAWQRFSSKGHWYYEIIAPGFKYNLTDVAAALGVIQLQKADRFLRERQKVAEAYTSMLSTVSEIILPSQLPNRIHSWHLYAIRLKLETLSIDRGQFIAELKSRGIHCSVHWIPLHQHPYYRKKYGHKDDEFPMASQLGQEVISLPLYPAMLEEEIEYTCKTITEIVQRNRRKKVK